MALVTLKAAPPGIPAALEVGENYMSGGEGRVYFSLDGKYAVKVYQNPSPDREKLLQTIMTQFRALRPDEAQFILPPLALVDRVNGTPRIGFLMRCVPSQFQELISYILNPFFAAEQFKKGHTWADYLKLARSLARAITVLHGKGCAHSDIHYRNFLAEMRDGSAVMLEIDGVVVEGFLPPQVKGMRPFMAPEILTQKQQPRERTDRHSLAVLILHTLLFRNVMEPQIDYADDPEESENLGYGQFALFSEHPGDRRHRPRSLGLPLYRRGTLSYRILTRQLQKLTERALIEGLHAPDKRPLVREWEAALAFATDELWRCSHCMQYFPYPHYLKPRERRECPFCGRRLARPYPVVLELHEETQRGLFQSVGRHLILWDRFQLFADVTTPGRKPPVSRRLEPTIGHAEWSAQRKVLQLVNDADTSWTFQPNNGAGRLRIGRGESLPLEVGTLIRFGEGARLGIVLE